MVETNGNGSQIARIDERTEAMQREFADFRSEVRDALKLHKADHKAIDDCIGELQTEQARLDERLSTANQRQAVFTTLGTIFAAIFGKVT